ncbi:MAG: N-glycosylase/DNA lyase [bacterium]
MEKDKKIKELLELYKKKKKLIKERLNEFEAMGKKDDEEIYAELCFCILTPQSKPEHCDFIIKTLSKKGLLHTGSELSIQPYLKKARFFRNKSSYLVGARKLFVKEKKASIKNRINRKNTNATRDWLVENVKGMSFKEASHFLRNIGLGSNVAILDIHVMRSLRDLGVIKEIPKSLSRKRYLEIEKKMKGFAKKINVPMDHLDLLFWSDRAQRIFK